LHDGLIFDFNRSFELQNTAILFVDRISILKIDIPVVTPRAKYGNSGESPSLDGVCLIKMGTSLAGVRLFAERKI
jgi:hypothetical protein